MSPSARLLSSSLAALVTASTLAFGVSSAMAQTPFSPANPFYAPSTLPFQAPPFDHIRNADYQPAIDAGMEQHLAEVMAIANNAEPPSFENTFAALEKSGRLLDRVMRVFQGVTGANTNPELQKVRQYEAPRLAAHEDAIYLNARLFERVSAIYQQRDTLPLDPESRRLVEITYRRFVHQGANLSQADRERLKKLNEEESTLSTEFRQRLLAGTKAAAYTTTDTAALAGLSEQQIAAAAQPGKPGAPPQYVLPLQNTTQQPDLMRLSDRATRQSLFEHSWTRTERGDANDTRELIVRLAERRTEKAALLGFPTYAAWKLEDQMARTPDAALHFMNELVPAATAKAQNEAHDIQDVIDAQKGGFQLQPWDWEFYAEQVRKAQYDLDEAQLKPYFELSNVLENGVFYAANQLYGITFRERKNLPVYQPDVRVFEVSDADGKPLALFYCDYFKRDNKEGGAWMSNFVGQSRLLGTLPVVYNVANFTKPAAGQPALISFSDVTTMFHEFGHALHGMFADAQYPTLSGTGVPRDFVEFPSQFNEHWATYPAVFQHYAHDYRTGAPMPAELAARIKKSATFNQGYALTELLAAAELDMQWHTLPRDATVKNADEFGQQALAKTHLNLSYVPPRYRSSYFAHIWANGYSGSYYAYLWSEMLDDAAYAWFEEHGGLTRANGDRFRHMVLSRGNTEELQAMYDAWLGGEPKIGPMLKYRGLAPADSAVPPGPSR
jgi:peptidyl-dipeptidase Dcp